MIMDTLQQRIEAKIIDVSHLAVLGVAIGHIHDLLYDEYGDELVFASTLNKSISMINLMDPDGLEITIENDQTPIVHSTSLTSTIYDSFNRTVHSDDDILNYVDILEYIYDLMIMEDMEPEQHYEYG